MTAFKELVEYFGDDPKTMTPEILFGTIDDFLESLERADAENKAEIEKERLTKQRAEQAELLKKKAASVKPRGPAAGSAAAAAAAGGSGGADESRTMMDDLIATIRSGAVFENRNDVGGRRASETTGRPLGDPSKQPRTFQFLCVFFISFNFSFVQHNRPSLSRSPEQAPSSRLLWTVLPRNVPQMLNWI